MPVSMTCLSAYARTERPCVVASEPVLTPPPSKSEGPIQKPASRLANTQIEGNCRNDSFSRLDMPNTHWACVQVVVLLTTVFHHGSNGNDFAIDPSLSGCSRG